MTHTYENKNTLYYRGKVGGPSHQPVVIDFDIAVDYKNDWLSIKSLLEPDEIEDARKEFLERHLKETEGGSNPDDDYDQWKAESREA